MDIHHPARQAGTYPSKVQASFFTEVSPLRDGSTLSPQNDCGIGELIFDSQATAILQKYN